MRQVDTKKIEEIAKALRYWSLKMSTQAGSGHPTSALSSADLMATLFATTFRYDLNNPNHPNNDRLIFSKGHATPLFYSLFALAGGIKIEKLNHYREFTSPLEGHPTPRFRFTEAATGSLGQGLSIGVGYALNAKYLDKLTYRTFVLLGDGEMAEGSVWEAIEVASYYKLDNLVAILDVNRLGQSGPTMLEHDVATYKKRLSSFGWQTKIVNGHSISQIVQAYRMIGQQKNKPYAIIAKTIKGKGVDFLEDKEGWHGKPLSAEQFEKACQQLEPVNKKISISVRRPRLSTVEHGTARPAGELDYRKGDQVPTRKAYGWALAKLGGKYPKLVVLDGDVNNSTYSQFFKQEFPDRFFEMFIAEQNMVGAAVGLARKGKIPFVSTFSAFMTRAFDQIRMAAVSQANIKFCGSHAGVSIGQDGPSQMGLEDIAMFRAVHGCRVLYPADAVATHCLVKEMIESPGMAYIRTTRPPTPVIYDKYERFYIGGLKIHRAKNMPREESGKKGKVKGPRAIIVAAGITLYQALEAQKELAAANIETIVVDCYSIKPIDKNSLLRLGKTTGLVITVEDHWFEGGLGDAVLNVFSDERSVRVVKLAVRKMPRSGKPEELLAMAGIDKKSIMDAVKKGLRRR